MPGLCDMIMINTIGMVGMKNWPGQFFIPTIPNKKVDWL
jgi:hypothetical protein